MSPSSNAPGDQINCSSSAMGRRRAGRRGRGGGEESDGRNDKVTTTLKPNDEELGGQYVKFSECIYNRLVRLNHTVCSCHEEYEALSEMIAYSSLSLYDDTCVNAEAAAKFPY